MTVVQKSFSSSFSFLTFPQNLLFPRSHCFIMRMLVRNELSSTKAGTTGPSGTNCAGRRNLVFVPRCCFTFFEQRSYWSAISEDIGILSNINADSRLPMVYFSPRSMDTCIHRCRSSTEIGCSVLGENIPSFEDWIRDVILSSSYARVRFSRNFSIRAMMSPQKFFSTIPLLLMAPISVIRLLVMFRNLFITSARVSDFSATAKLLLSIH